MLLKFIFSLLILFLPSIFAADEPLKKVGEMDMAEAECNRVADQEYKRLEEQQKKKAATSETKGCPRSVVGK